AHRLRLAVQVEHQTRIRVPAGHDRVAPPVAALIVVHVPRDHRVVGVAGVVVLRVDLHAVPVRVAQVQVERVGYAVPTGPALDGIGVPAGAEDVADRQDVVLLVRGEGDVVHAR